MSDELFSRRESVKDILKTIEKKLKNGLFEESMDCFDRIMSMDFEYPNLYENIYCVKFWINRTEKIKSLKESDITEYCTFLDLSFKRFLMFIKDKQFNIELLSIKAIHYFVYNEIIKTIIEKNNNNIQNKEELYLIANAFIEFDELSKALQAYRYLNDLEPYNSKILSNIAQLNHLLGDEKKAKMYIREALFYDPLSIEFENITIEVIRDIRDIIINRNIHNSSNEEIILWMSAYGELMNLLDIKKPLNEEDEIHLRKIISKLESDYRKFKLREATAPRLLASLAYLTTTLIMRNNKEDMAEIRMLGSKMASIDKELLQYYIKILNDKG